MPLATPEQVADFIRDHGPIRLSCDSCVGGIEHDGVQSIPVDWINVSEEQSLQAALSVYDGDDDPAPAGWNRSEWWTHLGTCPDCQK